jgi:hypothetical protein
MSPGANRKTTSNPSSKGQKPLIRVRPLSRYILTLGASHPRYFLTLYRPRTRTQVPQAPLLSLPLQSTAGRFMSTLRTLAIQRQTPMTTTTIKAMTSHLPLHPDCTILMPRCTRSICHIHHLATMATHMRSMSEPNDRCSLMMYPLVATPPSAHSQPLFRLRHTPRYLRTAATIGRKCMHLQCLTTSTQMLSSMRIGQMKRDSITSSSTSRTIPQHFHKLHSMLPKLLPSSQQWCLSKNAIKNFLNICCRMFCACCFLSSKPINIALCKRRSFCLRLRPIKRTYTHVCTLQHCTSAPIPFSRTVML